VATFLKGTAASVMSAAASVNVSGEASNGTKSLLRVRMSGFPTSASAMAEQAMCSLERSFLNGKPLKVEDGRAVCDPTTSTASFVHAECASQPGSSSISNTLSASDVSATMLEGAEGIEACGGAGGAAVRPIVHRMPVDGEIRGNGDDIIGLIS
jgi:hypothetical protein